MSSSFSTHIRLYSLDLTVSLAKIEIVYYKCDILKAKNLSLRYFFNRVVATKIKLGYYR